jgi:hypothetical protein
MGRPSLYSEELVDTICDRLIEGESLRSICRDESMPGKRTIFDWLVLHDAFRTKYARAREIQSELKFDELQEIADDGTNDWMEKRDRENAVIGWQVNGEHVKRSELRVATLKWRLAKLQPKKYGEKVDLTNSDGSFSGAFARLIAEEGGVERDSRSDSPDAGARSA